MSWCSQFLTLINPIENFGQVQNLIPFINGQPRVFNKIIELCNTESFSFSIKKDFKTNFFEIVFQFSENLGGQVLANMGIGREFDDFLDIGLFCDSLSRFFSFWAIIQGDKRIHWVLMNFQLAFEADFWFNSWAFSFALILFFQISSFCISQKKLIEWLFWKGHSYLEAEFGIFNKEFLRAEVHLFSLILFLVHFLLSVNFIAWMVLWFYILCIKNKICLSLLFDFVKSN